MNADPTLLGTVEDVSGASIRIKLGQGTVSGLSFIEGQSYRIGQVGGFVRIPLGFVNLYGVISQVGASAVPERLAEIEQHGKSFEDEGTTEDEARDQYKKIAERRVRLGLVVAEIGNTNKIEVTAVNPLTDGSKKKQTKPVKGDLKGEKGVKGAKGEKGDKEEKPAEEKKDTEKKDAEKPEPKAEKG